MCSCIPMYYYFPNFLRGLRNRRLLTRGRVRAAMAEEQDEDSPVRGGAPAGAGRRGAGARASLRAVDEMVEGRRPFTVILDDPFGNSGILHDEAEVRPLTEREVKNLKTGMFVLEPGPSAVRPRASP